MTPPSMTPPTVPPVRRAVLSLGSNLGDRAAHLHSAVEALRAFGEVVAVSAVHETAPVGGPEQPDYLNAVVLLDTDLEPLVLLRQCQAIERAAGRVRGERWGPRELDIDLVVVGDLTCDTDELTLPHPRARKREFVLRPWLEVDRGAHLGVVPVAILLHVLLDREHPPTGGGGG